MGCGALAPTGRPQLSTDSDEEPKIGMENLGYNMRQLMIWQAESA